MGSTSSKFSTSSFTDSTSASPASSGVTFSEPSPCEDEAPLARFEFEPNGKPIGGVDAALPVRLLHPPCQDDADADCIDFKGAYIAAMLSCPRNPVLNEDFFGGTSSIGGDGDPDRNGSSSFGLVDEESDSSGAEQFAAYSAINFDVSPPSGISDLRL